MAILLLLLLTNSVQGRLVIGIERGNQNTIPGEIGKIPDGHVPFLLDQSLADDVADRHGADHFSLVHDRSGIDDGDSFLEGPDVFSRRPFQGFLDDRFFTEIVFLPGSDFRTGQFVPLLIQDEDEVRLVTKPGKNLQFFEQFEVAFLRFLVGFRREHHGVDDFLLLRETPYEIQAFLGIGPLGAPVHLKRMGQPLFQFAFGVLFEIADNEPVRQSGEHHEKPYHKYR